VIDQPKPTHLDLARGRIQSLEATTRDLNSGLRRKDARIKELEEKLKRTEQALSISHRTTDNYREALDEIFLRSMSSTCTFNEIQTIVSRAKG